MRVPVRALPAVLAIVVAGVGCAQAPLETSAPTPAGTAGSGRPTDFLACQVTASGGVDDRSFNQSAFAGLERAERELGVEVEVSESQTESDYQHNISASVERGCDIIVTVGSALEVATADAARGHPDQAFAIVDVDFRGADGEDVTYDNVRELTFATDQAAFLAGYLAAGMSKTHKVGTFGGSKIPTVTQFMDGFHAGVQHHNREKHTDVQVLGWDPADPDSGLFSGDLEDSDAARGITEALLEGGADIILPVAGPAGLGAAAAVEESGEEVSAIWIVTDGCETAVQFCEVFLTSVMKNVEHAVLETVKATLDGGFEGGLYTGTLDNDGVGIAPLLEFVPELLGDLRVEL
ncbi:MAG TPA: BMP family ABC transporter substrate-binding protein, partial [Nitriliruptorales bacterium]|nr:BMP family ABC transporter substrate-binding protein [Nitriliruptorales bacterium]